MTGRTSQAYTVHPISVGGKTFYDLDLATAKRLFGIPLHHDIMLHKKTLTVFDKHDWASRTASTGFSLAMLYRLLLLVAAVAAFQGPAMPANRPAVVRSAVTPVMGATVKELRERVSSVKNTKKITSAMKLVAAAKVRRAQEAVLRSRPFSETLERILGGLLERLSTESLDIPLMETRTAQKVALVVVTGDRGLCGGYNANAIKKAEQRIAELKEQGVEVELITVGNKGSTYFKKRVTPVRASYACGQAPTATEATTIAGELLSSYYAGEVDRVELLYTSFVSMISSVPSIRTIIPLSPGGIEMEGDEIFKLTTKEGGMAISKEKVAKAEAKDFAPDMIFEQEPSQLLNAILPLYLNGQLLRVLQESVASELASRMTAMQSATDNAKDLQARLETEMNRARQAKITQELMEIIAGADATG